MFINVGHLVCTEIKPVANTYPSIVSQLYLYRYQPITLVSFHALTIYFWF